MVYEKVESVQNFNIYTLNLDIKQLERKENVNEQILNRTFVGF